MPRLFNNAAGERIEVTGAANLAGFTWTFGTVACIFKLNNTTGTQSPMSLLYSGGINFQWYYDGGTMTYWRSGSGSDFSYSPGTANTHLGVISKGTGVVAPLFAFLNMNTGVWSSGAGSGTVDDQGTMTNVVIGADDTAGNSRFRGEIWEMAWWSSYAMTLPEIKRMAGGNFGRFAPTAWAPWPAGRDSQALPLMHGQRPMRPSTHVGATVGVAPSRNPPGWQVPVVARRR